MYTAPTIDQVVARAVGYQTRFSSIEVGISRRVAVGEGTTLTYLSHSGPDQPNPPEYDPARLFARIFGGDFAAPQPGAPPAVDPTRALEASMDGFRVMPMGKAAREGDLFITVTGNRSVLRAEHFKAMKDRAIVANSGHFNVEIDIPALEKLAKSRRTVRDLTEEFMLRSGRRIYLLADGRLVNLSAAEGHPAVVMDMSFANQALCVEHIVKRRSSMPAGVYPVPIEIDRRIASLKLKTMKVSVDKLTKDQQKYLASWSEGT